MDNPYTNLLGDVLKAPQQDGELTWELRIAEAVAEAKRILDETYDSARGAVLDAYEADMKALEALSAEIDEALEKWNSAAERAFAFIYSIGVWFSRKKIAYFNAQKQACTDAFEYVIDLADKHYVEAMRLLADPERVRLIAEQAGVGPATDRPKPEAPRGSAE